MLLRMCEFTEKSAHSRPQFFLWAQMKLHLRVRLELRGILKVKNALVCAASLGIFLNVISINLKLRSTHSWLLP